MKKGMDFVFGSILGNHVDNDYFVVENTKDVDLKEDDLSLRFEITEEENITLKSETLRLSNQMQELQDEITKSVRIENELNQSMMLKDNEIKILASQLSDAVRRVHQALKEVEIVSGSNEDLKLELAAKKQEVSDLNQILKMARDEKHSVSAENENLSDELRQVKEAARAQMETLNDELCELELILEENHVHILRQLSECARKLKVVTDRLGEQEVRLIQKEKMVSEWKEKESKKIEELEERLREKEGEALAKDEEKREAIRQLCLMIEYHRENFNHLRELRG